MHQPPETGILRISNIFGDHKVTPSTPAIIPVSMPTWWAGVKTNLYPQPVRLGKRCTSWRDEDLRRYIESAGGEA